MPALAIDLPDQPTPAILALVFFLALIALAVNDYIGGNDE